MYVAWQQAVYGGRTASYSKHGEGLRVMRLPKVMVAIYNMPHFTRRHNLADFLSEIV